MPFRLEPSFHSNATHATHRLRCVQCVRCVNVKRKQCKRLFGCFDDWLLRWLAVSIDHSFWLALAFVAWNILRNVFACVILLRLLRFLHTYKLWCRSVRTVRHHSLVPKCLGAEVSGYPSRESRLLCLCLQPICGCRHLATSRESKAHFGLPWVRPCRYYRGKCYMDGKRIQCLANASQHVPI